MAEAQANRHETTFLPSASLLTNAIPGMTLFVRYQQGFRPGGLAVDDYHVTRFRNDRIGTLEAGLRRGVPGYDPVAIAASAAYTNWRNIQADLTDRRGLPTTTNIGDGRIYTLEGRVVVTPATGFSIDGSFIYNNSLLSQPASYLRMLSYEGRSLSLPNVANLGGRLATNYRAMLDNGDTLQVSASARYVGKSRLGVGPIFGREQGIPIGIDLVELGLFILVQRHPAIRGRGVENGPHVGAQLVDLVANLLQFHACPHGLWAGGRVLDRHTGEDRSGFARCAVPSTGGRSHRRLSSARRADRRTQDPRDSLTGLIV